MGTSGGILNHRLYGPIVAVEEAALGFYEDITLADFRHIIDYLISYLTTEVRESESHTVPHLTTKIREVKICCFGEIKLHGSEPYISVDVPRAHPTPLIFCQGEACSISKPLGMPLRLWKYLDIETWIDPPGWDSSMTADSNHDASSLIVEVDLDKLSLGMTPLHWTMDIGNVLAVRDNGKYLAVDDVKAMCQFATQILQPMFEDALGGGFILWTKQEVLDFFTWENMAKCWDEMVEESGISSVIR